MDSSEIDILKRALAREKAARKAAEKILEEKSAELYELNQQLEASKSELELQFSKTNSQLQGVFENINDAYLVMNLQGDVLNMNDKAIDLFGYNVDEESLNVLSLIYHEDSEYAFSSFEQLKENGFFTDYTARVHTKHKGVRWIQINASIIFDRHKTPIAAQGIIRDITEAKNSSEIIKEQKKQLDAIVQNSPVGIVLTNQGKIVRTNEAFQNTIGYSENELSKMSVKDVSLKEDFPASKSKIEQMDAGTLDNFQLQKRYKRKDGSVLWAKTNVSAVRDNKGEVKYQVALVEDITVEREQSLVIDMINDLAKAILGKVDIYDIAWEITNNIAQYLGTEDCIIYLVNHNEGTVEQIAAYGEKASATREITNKITMSIGQGIVGTVAQTGIAECINDTSKDKRYVVDDEVRLSEISVPIVNDGVVIGVIDSEHSNKNYFTQQHLKTLQNIASIVSLQLKSAINLREREKVESKNRDLLVALEKSNDELQEYAHIVSHDLKSPLRSINALINWIKEDNQGKFDDTSLENFGLIDVTLEKMEQLISDILAYSSAGADTLKKQDVDINKVIADVEQLLFIPEHITLKVFEKMPVIKGDKAKLQQLFQNLIGNAIKFNDKPKGKVHISVSDKKSYYQFSISDNGIGIDKRYHDKIFKIFHALNKGKESTGIGLSIVKKIVDVYKGEIWVESEPGKGTTFHFTLKK